MFLSMCYQCQQQESAPPGQYTIEQIAVKVGASIAAGHALQNMHKLYLTGAYSANETAQLQTAFGKHFKEVYTKDTLLHGNAKDFLGKLDGMQAAIVDLEVCKQATIFIGNNHCKFTLLQRSASLLRCGTSVMRRTTASVCSTNVFTLFEHAYHCRRFL
jgi:hypothetical protein